MRRLVVIGMIGIGVFWGILIPLNLCAQPKTSPNDFFYLTTKTFGPDSIRVDVHWRKQEKETVSLKLILMDFEGKHAHTWEKRLKLMPGTSAFAKFGKIRPTLYGLDSASSVLGIEAKLSCGCEDREYLHYYKPIGKQALAYTSLATKLVKDRKGWSLTFATKTLARDVAIIPRGNGWLVEENHFDLLPGEEKAIRLHNATTGLKPKMEDFIFQTANPISN